MTKIAVILILVGLTVMVGAYSLRRPYFDRNVLTGEQDENAKLQEIGNKSYTKFVKPIAILCPFPC